VKRLTLVLLLAAAARAQHVVRELDCPPRVDYRVLRDLDGDGLDDLLLVSAGEIWLWRGRAEPISKAPDVRMRMPERAAMFDVADGGVTVRTPDAYWALVPGAAPRRLERRSGPGLPPHPANVLWRALTGDFDADGKADAIDVSLQGYAIDFAGGDRVVLPVRLEERADTAVDAASDRILTRFAVGEWTAGEFSGDLQPDFAVLTDAGLLVYTGDAKGRFDPARYETVPIAEARHSDLVFRDFNRDGRTDVLAVRKESGKAVVIVADPRTGLARGRRLRLTVPGEIRRYVVTDIDGDGFDDCALPYVPRFTMQDAVRMATRSEVVVKVPVFLNRSREGGAPFASIATTVLSLPVRVRVYTDSVGRIKLSALVVVEYGGDLDGDGRSDLLVTDKPDRLAVHRGVPDTVFHERPYTTLKVPDCSDYEAVQSAAANLNGDARSDIILHYRGAGRRPDRLFVLWSRKK